MNFYYKIIYCITFLCVMMICNSCNILYENIFCCTPQILDNSIATNKISNVYYHYYVYHPDRKSRLKYNKRNLIIKYSMDENININKNNVKFFLNGKKKKIHRFRHSADELSFKIRNYGQFSNDTVRLYVCSTNLDTLINTSISFSRDNWFECVWHFDYIKKNDWDRQNGKISK